MRQDVSPGGVTRRLPPPVLAIGLALASWLCSYLWAPAWPKSGLVVGVALVLALAGTALDVSAKRLFVRGRTTVNPLRPEAASVIVRSGAYRWTRNPMYLGRLLQLTALGVYLGSLVGLAGVVLFALYLDRWQIPAEERALARRFPQDYGAYLATVRRWL